MQLGNTNQNVSLHTVAQAFLYCEQNKLCTHTKTDN